MRRLSVFLTLTTLGCGGLLGAPQVCSYDLYGSTLPGKPGETAPPNPVWADPAPPAGAVVCVSTPDQQELDIPYDHRADVLEWAQKLDGWTLDDFIDGDEVSPVQMYYSKGDRHIRIDLMYWDAPNVTQVGMWSNSVPPEPAE